MEYEFIALIDTDTGEFLVSMAQLANPVWTEQFCPGALYANMDVARQVLTTAVRQYERASGKDWPRLVKYLPVAVKI